MSELLVCAMLPNPPQGKVPHRAIALSDERVNYVKNESNHRLPHQKCSLQHRESLARKIEELMPPDCAMLVNRPQAKYLHRAVEFLDVRVSYLTRERDRPPVHLFH